MNDTWCLRIELRNLLPHPKLERRLKSTYAVLLLLLLFALGTQFAVRPVDPVRLDALIERSAFLRLLDFAGGGAYGNASIFGVSVLFLVGSRALLTLAMTLLPPYRRLLEEVDAGKFYAAQRLERHFRLLDVASALAFAILLATHELRHGVIAGDVRSVATAVALSFAGAILLLLLMQAIEASQQADGLQAILATGFLLSAVRWVLDSRSFLLLAAGTLIAALVLARVMELYTSVKIPLLSPATSKRGRTLMDVSITPESPFGLDRIVKTAVVLLCAWAFDRLRGLSPLFVTAGAPFLATCALVGLVAVASRFAHLAQVSKHMRRGGTWIDGIRPGDRTAEYLRRRVRPTLTWEVAFVAIALLAATLLPIRAHPLTFLGMGAVVEVCVSMYMHWKWVWRRDETLARRYGKYNPHTSTR